MSDIVYNMGLIALFSVGLLFIFVIWAIIIVFITGMGQGFIRAYKKSKEAKANTEDIFRPQPAPRYDDGYKFQRPENFHDN